MSTNVLPAGREAEAPGRHGFVFPASFAQRRLWFLNQFDPMSSAYNIPFPMRLNIPLDRGALERSLQEIVRRHESLRTTFTTQDGEPVQVVAPAQTFNLEAVDLRSLPAGEREAEAHRLAIFDAQRPFSLTNGPLLRVTLIQLGVNDHILLLTMHHVISDGWSMNVLVRELSALYGSYALGRPSPLEELPVQYADFAVWQREWLAGEVLERQLEYWRGKLGDAPGLLRLPTDRPRPAVQTYYGAAHAFTLEPQLYEHLKALSQREGVTLFMTLLAAFKVLLLRYTGQTDLVVGTPIANRTRVETEGLIGFFANTLALRTDLSDDPTFVELLGRVRETTLGAYQHQDMPFERLVEELQPERNLSHNPLFQVMFIYQSPDGARTQKQSSGAADNAPLVTTSTAKFDLTLCIGEVGRAVGVSLEYNTDLFDQTTIERLGAHFKHLLEGIVRRPNARLSDLPLLTEVELQQLLVEWNSTEADYGPACLHELFERQAERTPEAVGVVCGGERLTYSELNERSDRVARRLRGLRVGPGSLVGLYVERSVGMVVGILGVLKAGAAYVPLDSSFPNERLRMMVEDAGLRVLLTQESLARSAAELGASEVVCEDAPPLAAEPPVAGCLEPRAAPDDLAYVIYTSGSTGRPKGVMIAHRAVHNLLAAVGARLGFRADDVLLSVTTLSFDIAGLEIFLPLVGGARVVVANREEASDGVRLAKLLASSGATVMQATPSTLRMLIEAGWRGDRRLMILCGGEPMSRDLADELLGRCRELWNMYGPTETTIWSATQRVEASGDPIPIGRPLANTQVYILDARARPVPAGVVGELYIAGDGLAYGYLKRPDLTAEKFLPDPFSPQPGARLYRTGDLARYLSDGRIECLGRVDYQVKIRGFRIELGEVEAALREQASVRDAVVMAHEDTSGDKRLVAYLVSGEGVRPTADELRRALKVKLPDYMVPSHFVSLETLPLLPNGKLNRRALPAPDGSSLVAGETPYVAPRNPVEQQLARLIGEILKHERVGVHDNFFELGGHSLLATRAVARIQQTYGVSISLRSFFESPTVEGFALAVAESLQSEAAAAERSTVPRYERRDETEAAVTRLSDDEVTAMLETLAARGDEKG